MVSVPLCHIGTGSQCNYPHSQGTTPTLPSVCVPHLGPRGLVVHARVVGVLKLLQDEGVRRVGRNLLRLLHRALRMTARVWLGDHCSMEPASNAQGTSSDAQQAAGGHVLARAGPVTCPDAKCLAPCLSSNPTRTTGWVRAPGHPFHHHHHHHHHRQPRPTFMPLAGSVSTSSAPKARSRMRRSSDILARHGQDQLQRHVRQQTSVRYTPGDMNGVIPAALHACQSRWRPRLMPHLVAARRCDEGEADARVAAGGLHEGGLQQGWLQSQRLHNNAHADDSWLARDAC